MLQGVTRWHPNSTALPAECVPSQGRQLPWMETVTGTWGSNFFPSLHRGSWPAPLPSQPQRWLWSEHKVLFPAITTMCFFQMWGRTWSIHGSSWVLSIPWLFQECVWGLGCFCFTTPTVVCIAGMCNFCNCPFSCLHFSNPLVKPWIWILASPFPDSLHFPLLFSNFWFICSSFLLLFLSLLKFPLSPCPISPLLFFLPALTQQSEGERNNF